MSEIDDEAIAAALDRIAMTPDGALLYAYLQKISIGVLTGDPSDGALRQNHGARSVAAKLMGLMARGIDESAERTDSATRASERPVVFLTRKPVVADRSRGAGRRISADTRVPGWDAEPNPDTAT